MTAPDRRRRYPGVRAFEEADAVLFYGRQAAADQLLLRVLSVRLLLQFAPSGVGKTSLLQAGLFPPLRRHECFPFIARVNRPEEGLVDAVRRSMLEACEAQGLQDPVVPAGAADLAALLGGTQLWSADASLLTPVLVLDQFEEIFTLRDEAFRQDLARQVGALVGQRGGTAVKVVLSLREEFLGRLEQFSREIPELFAERLRLPPLTGDEARLAITEPAAHAAEGWASPPFAYDPRCVDELVDFIDGSSVQNPLVEPLTLQLVCAHGEDIVLQRAAAGQPQAPLTLAHFGGLDGLRRLVSDHYEHELAQLPAKRRAAARQMFERGLLDPAGKRLMLEEGEIQRDHGLAREDLDRLVAGRLLRREPRNDSLFYEIGHDRLAEAIARRRRAQLPRWVVPALALAALLVVSLAAGALYFRYLKDEAENQAFLADQARDEAERAYGLLLGDDLIDRLRETGASDALEEVLRKIDRRDAEDTGVPANLRLARLQGDLALHRGQLVEAREHYAEALKMIEDQGDADPTVVERARLHARLSDVALRAGQLGQAEADATQAATAWQQVLQRRGTLLDRLGASDAQARRADLLVRADERARAEAPARESVALALDAWIATYADPPSPDLDMRYLRGLTARALGDALLARAGVWGNDPEAYALVQGVADEAGRLRPYSVLARQGLAIVGGFAGRMGRGSPDQLLPRTGQAARALERLLRGDPGNLQLQRDHAVLVGLWADQLGECLGLAACRRIVPSDQVLEVQAELLHAVGALRRLVAADAERRDWALDLGWVLGVQARLTERQGDLAAALAQYDAALAQLSGRPEEVAQVGTGGELAVQQARRAGVLLRLGRTDDAAAARAQAQATLRGLPEPDRPRWAVANVLDELAQGLGGGRQSAEARALEARAKAQREALGAPWEPAQQRAREANDRAVDLVQKAARLAPAEALPLLQQAIDLHRTALAENPFDPVLWRNLQYAYEWRASRLQDTGNSQDQAEPRRSALAAAMAIAQIVVAVEPEDRRRRQDRAALAALQRDLVLHLRQQQDHAQAAAIAGDAATRARDGSGAGTVGALELALLRDAYVMLGWQSYDAGQEGWQDQLRVALELGKRLARLEPSDPEHWLLLGRLRTGVARYGPPQDRAGELAGAEQDCRRALTLATAGRRSAQEAQAADKLQRSLDGATRCLVAIDELRRS